MNSALVHEGYLAIWKEEILLAIICLVCCHSNEQQPAAYEMVVKRFFQLMLHLHCFDRTKNFLELYLRNGNWQAMKRRT